MRVLARIIGVGIALSAGFAVYKMIGIDTTRFGPFMLLITGGSFVGNVVGALIARRLARDE